MVGLKGLGFRVKMRLYGLGPHGEAGGFRVKVRLKAAGT
jgi:hypothetical protein